MRKLMLLCAGLMLAAVHSARADPITVSGGGAFTLYPGYGYEYQATWDATGASFSFTPSLAEDNRRVTFTGQFNAPSNLLDVTSLDLHATVQLRFVNLTTGLPGVPPAMVFFSGNADADYRVVQGQGEIRFSNPVESTAFSLTDPSGTSVVGVTRPFDPITTVTFRLDEHFVPGNFLSPSPDPSCASFSCMIPGHDLLQVVQAGTFLFSPSMVPEPASAGLLLAGLGIGTWLRRRRRGTAASAR